MTSELIIRSLNKMEYNDVWHAMQAFTDARTDSTLDEIWFVEHPPVYTLGQAGKPEHILNAGDIPVVHCDRGGQVTYHGPGQCVAYVLFDLRRRDMGVRTLVTSLENTVISLLSRYNITAEARSDAPGVYVGDTKICSIGLRVRRGYSYHGIALNVAMDLEPFQRINPCGFKGLVMSQISELDGPKDFNTVTEHLYQEFVRSLSVKSVTIESQLPETIMETH